MPVLTTFADLSARGSINSQGFARVRDFTNGTSSGKVSGTVITDSVTAQAGDLLVVFTNWEPSGASTPTISTVADTAGTTYTSAGALVPAPATTTSTAGTLSQAYYGIVPSGVASGTITVTVTLGAAAAIRNCQLVAFSNVKPILVNARTTSVGTATSGTLATGIANTGDLVLTFASVENNSIPTGASDTTRGSWSAVVGANSTGANANTNQALAAQYKIVTGQGTQTASFASLANNWAIHTYIFKGA